MIRSLLRKVGGVLFAVGVIASAVVGFFLVRSHNREVDRANCQDNLKNLALAAVKYAEDHDGRLPPAYVLGKDGKPWHSWRVLILPYIGQKELYDTYRFD